MTSTSDVPGGDGSDFRRPLLDRLLESDGCDESGEVDPIPLAMVMLAEVDDMLGGITRGLQGSDPNTPALYRAAVWQFFPVLRAVCSALVSGAAVKYPQAVREPDASDTQADNWIREAMLDLCGVVEKFMDVLVEKGSLHSPVMNLADLEAIVGRLANIRFALVTGMGLRDGLEPA